MKVGIDARLLSLQLTGIGRYTYEVVNNLKLSGTEIFLYSPAPINLPDVLKEDLITREQNLKSRFGRMLWSQTVLPYWAAKDNIDLFWGVSHRLPSFLPKEIAQVVTIHDMVWKRVPDTMRSLSLAMERLLMPRALQAADLIISDSRSTANDIMYYYPQHAIKVRVVHLSAGSCTKFQGKEKQLLNMGIERPYLLFVGTAEPRKNITRLIKAFGLMPRNFIEKYQLVICGGSGWGGVDVEREAKENGIEDRVIITGYVTDEQLSSLYNHAYCLVMPSLYEGFGLPILEAHSCGVPVITSNNSSMPEVAGEGAIYIDPFDVQDIASGLSKMLKNPAFREDLSNKAKINASRFSWGKAAEKTLDLFKKLVEKKCQKI